MRNRVAAIAAVMLLAGTSPGLAAPGRDWGPKPHETAPLPSGWVLRGDNSEEYEVGVDKSVTYAGDPSGFIRSIGFNLDGFGTLATRKDADAYRGKTVRLSAMVKTDRVQRWALLWVGYDTATRSFFPEGAKSPDFTMMRFTQSLVGSLDWHPYHLDIPLPADATKVFLGLVLSGRGTAYINQVGLDVVTPQVPDSGLDFGR